MTARQLYEAMLIEMNKTDAPSMLLEDFNYLANKAVYQYVNKSYNKYDVNQQATDDLRVLKATAVIPARLSDDYGAVKMFSATGVQETLSPELSNGLYGAVYEVFLPSDYLHILNCICNFKVLSTFKCYNKDSNLQFKANRLTSDMWGNIINNYYLRPMYKRPYYYIHNVNSNTFEGGIDVNLGTPTNPFVSATSAHASSGTDVTSANEATNTFQSIFGTSPNTISTVERQAGIRYGNPSNTRMEIRYGKDNSVFELTHVYIDYLKTPQYIRLSQEQVDLTQDTSQVLEYPDYICQEIINELVKLMLENSSDPRVQTHMAVNQTIANPVQQQSQNNNK